jgi:hypothetical protein
MHMVRGKPAALSPLRHVASALAREPPLRVAAGAEHDPIPDPALPPTPAYEFDRRIAW